MQHSTSSHSRDPPMTRPLEPPTSTDPDPRRRAALIAAYAAILRAVDPQIATHPDPYERLAYQALCLACRDAITMRDALAPRSRVYAQDALWCILEARHGAPDNRADELMAALGIADPVRLASRLVRLWQWGIAAPVALAAALSDRLTLDYDYARHLA